MDDSSLKTYAIVKGNNIFSASTHSPPPEGVCIGVEVCVDVFLCEVDQEGGKDQDQETYIPSCNQLL